MTVYAVQIPHIKQNNELVAKFDLSPAEEFGELRTLLTPGAKPFDPSIEKNLWDALEGFGDDDYILCIGNPVLIGIASYVAMLTNDGRAKFLQWSNGGYRVVESDFTSFLE